MLDHEKTTLIETFYTCFQQRDWAGMSACYHPNIVFSDPVFTALHGKSARAMWHMLIERGKDLTLEYTNVRVEQSKGYAHWEARYTFSASRRLVHNIIEAEFEFAEGKISRHRDTFHFWRWSRMALGTTGLLLGWSPVVRNKVRQTAQQGLAAFIAKHPEYQA
jgi:hypothetical protein